MDGGKLRGWQGFLEEEGAAEDGLWCFYDVRKSPTVAHLCGVLAQQLAAFFLAEAEGPAGSRRDSQQE